VRLVRRLGTTALAVLLLMAAFAVAPLAAQASSTDGQFFSLTNASRAANGQPAYVWRSDLASVAYGQAARMASSGKLYHNPNLATDVRNYSFAGENVGYGPTVSAIENAFINSPEHRANILDRDFTEVGVGSVTVNGRIWVSVVFRKPLGPAPAPTKTTPPAPAPPKAVAPVQQLQSPTRSAAPVQTVRRSPVPVHHVVRRPVLPKGVACSADAGLVRRLDALDQSLRTARWVAEVQRSLLGYQCGKGLALTATFNAQTVRALGR
jgi:hypothetical protein